MLLLITILHRSATGTVVNLIRRRGLKTITNTKTNIYSQHTIYQTLETRVKRNTASLQLVTPVYVRSIEFY